MVLDSSGYNENLKGLNAEMKKHQAELKLASEGIKAFGKDSEKLKSVQESLNKQLEIHSKKVDLYKQSIEKTTSKMQENIKERDKLKQSLEQANNKYSEAVKIYGKESTEAKKAKEEVEKLKQEHEKASKTVETNAKQIQNYETNLDRAKSQMVKTQGEIKKVNSELEKSENKWLKSSENLKNHSEKIKNVGSSIEKTGDSILKLTAPLAAAGIASFKFSSDFSDGIAKVNTIADTTKVPINELRKGALNLSKDFGVGATEITESMYQAMSASVPTEQAINFVATATKAAKGGFTDASIAVDGLSTVLNSYGLEAEKADEIANQMLITQNKGKTTFGELASAVGKVTPIASQLDITTQELFSSLASTTAQGLATSESVTALKAAMSNIVKPSKEASEAAELLGIDFSVSSLQTKGWIGFLKDMKEQLKSASPEFAATSDLMSENANKLIELERAGKKSSKEYKELSKQNKNLAKDMETLGKASDSPVSAMATMFGSVEGLNSILMLTSDNGMKTYNETMEEMKNNTTALDDAFNKMSSTPGEKFRKSLNSMKVSAIKFGDAIAPMVEKGSVLITKLSDKLGGLSDKQLENIAKWGAMSLALGGVLKVGGSAISGVGTMINGISRVTGWIGKFSGAAKIAEGATAGVSAASGVATSGIGAMGLATKAGALLLNPWVLGITAATVAGVALYKHLQKEAIPEVDLFAKKVETSTNIIQSANGTVRTEVNQTTVEISENTKKQVGSYIDLDKNASKSLMDLYVNGKTISSDTSKDLVDTYHKMCEQIKQGMNNHQKESIESLKTFLDNSKNISKEEQDKMLNDLKQHNEDQKNEIDNCEKRIKEILDKASEEKRELTREEQEEINSIQEKMKENAVQSLSDSEVESKVILERLKGYSDRMTAEQASEVIKNAEEQRKGAVEKAEKQYDQTVKQIIRMRDESKTITAEQADALIKDAERQKTESIDKATEMKSTVVGKIKEMNKDTLDDIDSNDGHIKTKWEKLKGWFADNPITRWIKSKTEDPETGHNWTGTNFWRGGLTYLHDAPGENSNYELYDLPKGTRIFNHDASQDLVMQTAESVATKVANSVLSGFSGNNGINVTQNIYSQVATPSEVARQTKNNLRELALSW